MLFNSIDFAVFLPVVFALYWFVTRRSLQLQNLLLLISSYVFYSFWDWRFTFLLVFSTLLDYFTGLQMSASRSEGMRRFWFWLSVIINLGFLGVFKYYNFFADSFAQLIHSFGWETNPILLEVVLPVGISFYTFHGLSYVIDIYYRRIEPERNFVVYSVFVSFFPLLVAGPIERATHLLPQIRKVRVFDPSKAVDGMRQILWGLFKKVVIADQCAEYANLIFATSETQSGSTLVLGAVLFAFQIYGDFSGYTDIALGVARLFGIELLRNFAYPYFSRDIAEFWRRWHISLSTWFRDYLYIPLGGSRGGKWKGVRNTVIVFLVSGFWHGANWTFIAWGALNAMYFLPLLIAGKNRHNLEIVAQGKIIPTPREIFSIAGTFALTVLAWIFFRADSISHAISYLSGIFSADLFSLPAYRPSWLFILIVIFFMIEWIGREQHHALARIGLSWPKPVRRAFYYAIALTTFFMAGEEQQFIYFQF